MIRALTATAMLATLPGCVAGIAAGAAAGVAVRAAGSSQAPEPTEPSVVLHGYGENPRWAVDVFDTVTVFYSPGLSISELPGNVTLSPNGHVHHGERITLSVEHTPCKPTRASRTYPLIVNVTVDGRLLRGCGMEQAHDTPGEDEES